MKKAALYGLVLVCVCVLFAMSGPSAQRIAPVSGIAATRPSQVEVTNFPAVQQVAGTVNVGNLPVDAMGRVLVAIQPQGSGALVLHSTSAAYTGDLGGRTGATQKCRAEFPNSHFATMPEVQNAWNTRGIVWLTSDTDWSWVDDLNLADSCSGNDTTLVWQATTKSDGTRTDGDLIRTKGTDLFNSGPCTDSHPIVCAE